MKGLPLAGGSGSRLFPLTLVTNKHLLPVYDRPMIYYPLAAFAEKGCREVMVVVGGRSVGEFVASTDAAGAVLKAVPDPHRFGVADFGADGRVISFEEKPSNPKSNRIPIVVYLFQPSVFDLLRELRPSARGETTPCTASCTFRPGSRTDSWC